MKEARKQERARRPRRAVVKGPVAESHAPLLVKIGVRTCRARRVPVGRRLARLAVPVRARWVRDGGGGVACWDLGDSGGLVSVGVGGLGMDVCFVVADLDLRDIFMGLRNVLIENIKRVQVSRPGYQIYKRERREMKQLWWRRDGAFALMGFDICTFYLQRNVLLSSTSGPDGGDGLNGESIWFSTWWWWW